MASEQTATVLMLPKCRECRYRVRMRDHGVCARCFDDIATKIHEHRKRSARRVERCANPSCALHLDPREYIAIHPETLLPYHWRCFPESHEVQR